MTRIRILEPPRPPNWEYDVSALDHFSAETLKRLVRHWVGKDANRMTKAACIEAAVGHLSNPEAVRGMVMGLTEFERAGLGLLQRRGGVAPTEEIAMELWVLGIPVESGRHSRRSHSDAEARFYEALNSLLAGGLVMPGNPEDRGWRPLRSGFGRYAHDPTVWSDLRILQHIHVVPPIPLDIAPTQVPDSFLAKSGAEVTLRFISLMEGLRRAREIEVTQKGRLAKPFMTKLAKDLGWTDIFATKSDTPLPNAILFLLKSLEGAGLLRSTPDGARMELAPEATDFLQLGTDVQAATWVQAYRSMPGWVEFVPPSVYGFREDDAWKIRKFHALRAGLLLALGALPDPSQWYRIRDIAGAIFERVSERFTFGYGDAFYRPFRATWDETQELLRQWQQKRLEEWQKNEWPWIAAAVTGPLFHLGLVDLAFEPRARKAGLALLRLSETGRAVLHRSLRQDGVSTSAHPEPAPSRPEGPCWVLQSNSEVMVHLTAASPQQLAFIERIAEQRSTQGAVALYALTRDSVYAGLETGLEIAFILEMLTKGAEIPIPDNVTRNLQDWAARREQMEVCLVTDVLEFASTEARDEALRLKRFRGQPIGDRFVYVPGDRVTDRETARCSAVANDFGDPPRCLTVSEDGFIQVDLRTADLHIRGHLEAFAERGSPDGGLWRITHSSVQVARANGWTAQGILETVQFQTAGDVPPLLRVAVRAWAGALTATETSVALATDVILQVPETTVARALAASANLAPFFRKQLGPSTFLVDRDRVGELTERLLECGLTVGGDLSQT